MGEAGVERLAEIRERADKATEGPWRADCIGSEGYRIRRAEGEVRGRHAWIAAVGNRQWDEDKADAIFIAHAREDIPFLLGVVEGLTAENARLREENEQAVQIVWDHIADCRYIAERDEARAEALRLREALESMVDWHERGDMDTDPQRAGDFRHDLERARRALGESLPSTPREADE